MKECPSCKTCFPNDINFCTQDGTPTTHSYVPDIILDGRYQFEKRLGQGGMGVVYKARHVYIRTSHAIKVIIPELVGNDEMLEKRFRQEALAIAAIHHRNVIKVTDFGIAHNMFPYLVMEYILGESLQDLLARAGHLSPQQAFQIIMGICEGINAAHKLNIIHRDLKPLNIMLQEDLPLKESVKILDFGLAKIKSDELLGSFIQAKTATIMGSPFYMSPEQWLDEEPGVHSDIYSLGIILYQMLTGAVPFRGNSIPAVMRQHINDQPPPLRFNGKPISSKIEEVIFHALEKEPEKRTRSVKAFMDELQAAFNVSPQSSIQTDILPPPSHQMDETMLLPSIDTDANEQTTSRLGQRHTRATTLHLRTNPPDSWVLIDGKSVGKTNNAGELVIQNISNGQHSLRIIHDDFADWERQIECHGNDFLIDISLTNISTQQQQRGAHPFVDINAQEIQRAKEEAERKNQEEARRKAEEDARIRAEQEARRRAEEEAKRKAEEEARRKAEEEAKRRAEEEARKKAEEEARRKAEEEARRKAEEEAKRRAEEEARKKAEEEARRRAEEEAKRKAEEEARRKAEEEARRKAEEEARRKAEEEARKKAEEEARRKAEEEAKRRAEEEARKKAEEEARRKAEKEAKRRAEEEARRKAEQEAKRKAEEEEAKKRAEEEARRKAEEEARKKAEEEARKKAEEEARRKAEEEAKRRAEEEARKKAEEEARKKAEEEARRKAEEEARRRAEEEARRKAEEEARRKAEEEAKRKAEEEEARRKAEEEAKRRAEEARRKAEEEARKKAEEEARKKAEEEARRKAEEEEARRKAEEARRREATVQLDITQQLSDSSDRFLENQQTTQLLPLDNKIRGGETLQDIRVNSNPNIFDTSSKSESDLMSSQPISQKSNSVLYMVIAGALVVVLFGGLGLYFLVVHPLIITKPQQKQEQKTTPDNSNNQSKIESKDGFILIPGGTFKMGRDDGDERERPSRMVTVKSFYMSKTEVTNEEYALFIQATGRTAPKNWTKGKFQPGQEKWPVAMVTLDDAKAYAIWLSEKNKVTYRLPKEEEWEYAARNGTKMTLYPWGNEFKSGNANLDTRAPTPVGYYSNGKNEWGILDLIGNVAEWTDSKRTIQDATPDCVQVVRGASWFLKSRENSKANSIYPFCATPEATQDWLGFRLVRDGS